jgi:hypothetical protein
MAMTKKKIILEDGRYLIYYTFEKKPAAKRREGKTHGGAK